MNSFELNKVAGGVLGVLAFTVALRVGSEIIFTPAKPTLPGYDLPEPTAQSETPGGAKVEASEPLPVLLAKADVKVGETRVKVCASCHNFEAGQGNKVGPVLHDVVGRVKASVASYGGYSATNKERGAKGEKWGYEEIDKFIANPKGYMQGTTMGFAGLAKAEDRAAVIAYLRSKTENPPPLPTP